MRAGFLLAAALLVAGAAAEIERYYWDGNVDLAQIRDFEGRFHARATPNLRFSVGGVIARVPEITRFYFVSNTYDEASLVLSIRSGANQANCTDFASLNEDHAAFSTQECRALLGSGIDSWVWEASIATADGTIESLETAVELVETPLRPWPLENDNRGWPPTEPNLAGNIMENYQSFSGAAAAYWHQGVDIRGGELQEVHSPVDGTVVQWVRYSSSDLYWSFMVEDELGFIWQFHHMDPDTVSLNIGDSVSQGDVIGKIIFWPPTHNGANYHHIHMNVVRPHPDWVGTPEPYIDGWQYYNPLVFLDPGNYNNTSSPETDGVLYYFEDEASTAFASSDDADVVVSGDIDIVVNLGSEFDATNDLPGHPYVNGLFEVGYQVEPLDIADDKARAHATISRLPLLEAEKLPNEWSFVMPDLGTADLDGLLKYVYRQSFTYEGERFTSIFDYNQRHLFYTVTNAVRGEPDSAGAWHTADLLADGSRRFPDGRYLVTVYARDFYGNEVHVEHTVSVSN